MRVVHGRRFDASPPRDEAKAAITRELDQLRRDMLALDSSSAAPPNRRTAASRRSPVSAASRESIGSAPSGESMGSAAAATSDEDRYAALELRISGLTQRLAGLREDGGSFACRGVPHCRGVEVTAEGRLVLCGDVAANDQMYYIADVGKVAPLPERWAGDSKGSTLGKWVGTGEPPLQAYVVQVKPRFGSHNESRRAGGDTIDLKLFAPAEFLEVMGAQLSRYNRRKRMQFRSLVAAHRQLRTPFAADCLAHRAMLRSLWRCVFPAAPVPTVHAEEDPFVAHSSDATLVGFVGGEHAATSGGWQAVGFSAAHSPQDDLVTTGILALQNVCYFARLFPRRFRAVVEQAVSQQLYPFVPVAVAVTQLLMNMLEMPAVALEDQGADVWRDDVGMNSVLLTFLYHVPHDEALSQVYCFLMGKMILSD